MSRTLPAALLTALSQPEVQPFYAIEALFDDDDDTRYDEAGYLGENAIRLWTGYGDKTVNSEAYIGSGDVLSISGLEEVNDLSAKNITITLNGIASSIISIALSEPYQRRLCRVYFGTDDTTAIEVFSGFMNTMSIEDSGETSTITLTVESKLVALERASNRRYTHENHVARNSGDTFFSFVADLQDKDVVWGRAKV
jgi:hypothetical protein